MSPCPHRLVVFILQVRDASNQWVPASQAATSPQCMASNGSSTPACGADVVLPVDGAWQWVGDWQLQVEQQAGGTDADGWQYPAQGSDSKSAGGLSSYLYHVRYFSSRNFFPSLNMCALCMITVMGCNSQCSGSQHGSLAGS